MKRQGARGSREAGMVMGTRRAEEAEEAKAGGRGGGEGEREEDEKVAGTYVRYAGEKHLGGTPPFRPRLRCALRTSPAGPAINSRLGGLLSLSFFYSPLQLRTSTRSTSQRIERPRGHTPSSREPAGRKKGGHDELPRALFMRFRHPRVIVLRRAAFCNFGSFHFFFGTS